MVGLRASGCGRASDVSIERRNPSEVSALGL